jgi:hypothetical protein
MVRIGVFCLVEVELRGLEPLTPCLQILWVWPPDRSFPQVSACVACP